VEAMSAAAPADDGGIVSLFREWMAASVQRTLSPLGSAHHHVDLAAAAPRTDQLAAPFEDAGFGAVASRMFGRIGLYLMLAFPAPHD
jgi:hypothetical protein